MAGCHGTPRAKAFALAILANREKLEVLGCFDAPGMAEHRKGHAPTITKGENAGSSVELDHIIPVHVAMELAARFYDLADMSERDNRAKGARITKHELNLARKWHREGLLSVDGLSAVEAAVE